MAVYKYFLFVFLQKYIPRSRDAVRDLAQIQVYNTLTRVMEPFETWTPGLVTMYVCGPTVYDVAHLGHARTYVAFDVIVRFLEYSGYVVKYVRNITDVGHLRETGEDRMLVGAERLKKHPMEVADKYMMEFFKDMESLGVRRPDIQPRASMHIPEIIEAVEKLLDKGYAYRVDGNVYFEVNKAGDYGQLSKIKPEDLVKHRIDPDPRKKNPADFALWKEAPQGYPFSWRTPWGVGFPGWHIECSVMSMKYLGERIDIHGGGHDLIFPHHENEIAQSEALTGKKPFVRYWLHTGELTVGGRGMHKSYGNFVTIRDALKQYSRDELRVFILSSHYRTPVDYSERIMEQAVDNASKIRTLHDNLSILAETAPEKDGDKEFVRRAAALKESFMEAMRQDFNTPTALASLYEFIKTVNLYLEKHTPSKGDVVTVKAFLEDMCRILGFLEDRGEAPSHYAPLLKLLLEVRRELRRRGIYDLGDRIRAELAEVGVIVEDVKDGERVRVVR